MNINFPPGNGGTGGKSHPSGHKIIVPIPVHVNRLSNLSQSQQMEKSAAPHHTSSICASTAAVSGVTATVADTLNLTSRGRFSSIRYSASYFQSFFSFFLTP